MSSETPLMKQFHEFKSQHSDAILFMRCGDFYEMFHEDAKIVSKELQIVLTSRNKNSPNPIPMAGIPHHAYEGYAAKLISKGYKIAMCEQVEDPKLAKGLVKRAVTQVITPGTVTLNGVLNPSSHNYLCSLYLSKNEVILSYIDVSTGEAKVTSFCNQLKEFTQLREELLRVAPSEILIHKKLMDHPIFQKDILKYLMERSIPFQKWEKRISKTSPLVFDWISKSVFNSSGLNKTSELIPSLEILFSYMESCNIQSEIVSLTHYETKKKLLLDPNTIRNLELLQSLYSQSKDGTLFSTLDKTVTASGARLLKSYILNPLIDKTKIETRYSIVSSLVDNSSLLHLLRDELSNCYDLFRLMNRLLNQNANGKDLLAIKKSLGIIPKVSHILHELNLDHLIANFNDLDSLVDLIEACLLDEAPQKITDGKLIRPSYNQELSHLHHLLNDQDQLLSDLEQKEKQSSNLKTLRIKYNRVFGYYLEIPKSMASEVPDYFIRRQTLTNVERYTTPELKKLETELLSAKDKVCSLEYKLFQELRDKVLNEITHIKQWAQLFSFLDVLCSFAIKAVQGQYCRPQLVEDEILVIENGRHPVVEDAMTDFVPNDHYFNAKTELIHIITGPNMGGKSTYLRQTAMIVLMAQMGSFVPADLCKMKVFDRIFTRVGASDDLGGGKSTFMVEMSETAYLLKHATSQSLILLDEIGRGTATFDGLSLAWSVIEYIIDELHCMTLFATHYHELTQISQLNNRIKNYSVSVLENKKEILFQHKIVRGSANRSYGIHVARLAGMPNKLLERADSILNDLESSKQTVIGLDTKSKRLCIHGIQTPLFEKESPKINDPILEKIDQTDFNSMTPIEALHYLYDLKEEIRKSKKRK
ncbi:MAG: DNA mismatch repair protein MutS [Candidatus Cloacimonadota bacterium]|nr:MAG: DNA mismatch repair protein MutS [Candidatus Cloacimonadota bacterium]